MTDAPPGLRDWTGYLIIKCGWWIQRQTEAALEQLELRDRHLMALVMLSAEDGMAQQDLARHLSLDPTLVVAVIDDLEDRGLRDGPACPSRSGGCGGGAGRPDDGRARTARDPRGHRSPRRPGSATRSSR